MASATINPSPEQRAIRTVERIKTLREAIPRAQAKGNDERVASLQAELDRRLAEVRDMKAALAEVDG
jgi:hypothetical protein